MSLDILRRNGGWCVELVQPIVHRGKKIETIEIRSPDLGQVARWGRREVPSSMAMLQELSDVPEAALLSLKYPDVDRVLMAYFNVIPKPMQDDFSNNRVPLVTPPELLPEEDRIANDPVDPRFPKADGPVARQPVESTPPPQFSEPEEDVEGLRLAPRPDIMKAVS